jgi:hypothetical protein
MTEKEHVFTVGELTEYLKSVVSNKRVKVPCILPEG